MTKTQLNEFRTLLMNRQVELEGGSRNRGNLALDTSSDEMDRIQSGQERDLAFGALDRNSKLLREVRDAIGRIDRGTFGVCLECDGDLSLKRLAAVPWTPACIVCQQSADNLAIQGWSVSEELLSSAG